MITYKQVYQMRKKAFQQPQALQDYYNGLTSFGNQQVNMQSGVSQSGVGNLAGFGLAAGIDALGMGLMGSFKNSLPSGQQIGRDAYQSFKQGIKQDLTNMGNAALDTAKNVGIKAGQATLNYIPGANMVYQAGKSVYNNWDTVKNTANAVWTGVNNMINPQKSTYFDASKQLQGLKNMPLQQRQQRLKSMMQEENKKRQLYNF